MSRWKGRIKKILALTLTVSLVGSGVNTMILSASAEEEIVNVEAAANADQEGSGEKAEPDVQKATTESKTTEEQASSAEADETTGNASDRESLKDSETSVSGGNAAQESDVSGGNAAQESDYSAAEEADASVEAVQALISALPAPEELQAQSPEERKEGYRQACEAFYAFSQLTEEQKELLDGGAEGIYDRFDLLLACYEELAQEDTGILIEEADVSNWLIQEGGFPAYENTGIASEGRGTSLYAEVNLEGAKAVLLQGLQKQEASINVADYNVPIGNIRALYTEVINFYPELFYVAGDFSYSLSGDGCVNVVMPTYRANSSTDSQNFAAAVEKAYNEAITDENMTALQKARALHDYLAQHIKYVADAPDAHNAYGALVNGEAVCQGYSLAYGALLKKAGIGFDYCNSAAMNHMWNYVQLDGAWYHVDVTWDDPTYDKVGYVRHKYFLCSDTQMNSEGSEADSKGHYSWVSTRVCDSDKYDNEYWKEWAADGATTLSAIFYINGAEYYTKAENWASNQTIKLIRRINNAEEEICSVPVEWNDTSRYWPGNYARLSYYDNTLYFNSARKIYSWKPGSTEAKIVCTYEDAAEYIFGALVCEGKVTWGISTNPNDEAKRTTFDLPSIPQGTVENKAGAEGYSTQYTYSASALPAPEKEQFSTTNSGGEFTFTWYRGSIAANNKLDSEPVDAGDYILHVAVSATEAYSEAELSLPVTIAKKQLTAEVRAENKVYDGTVTASVSASITEGIANGDEGKVSLTTPAGTFADRNAETGKAVTVTDLRLTGEKAANYSVSLPSVVMADITRRPVKVTADPVGKTFGEADPVLTFTIDPATSLAAGDTALTGELERTAGEDVVQNGYAITAGTLTNINNSNYEIAFTPGVFTIRPVDYNVTVTESQNILLGVGRFIEPVFTIENGPAVPGTVTYTYNNTDYAQGTQNTVENLVRALAALNEVGAEGDISYTFVPVNGNYNGNKSGSIHFTVRDIEFLVDGETASAENAVTVKENPVYGDDWSDIIQIGAITASAGTVSDSNRNNFSLNVSGKPDAGITGIPYQVVYNGTLNGKEYKNVPVLSGTVTVGRRTVTVSAGTYSISKVYDGSTNPGKASGSLSVEGILEQDVNTVSVSAELAEYISPDVGGQSSMILQISLKGDTRGNYMLRTGQVTVPCEITPKTVAPVLDITGTYFYTGNAVIPTFTVKVEDMELPGSDYTAEFVNNVNAGEARVNLYPKSGSNYTWNGAVTDTFVIEKVNYTGNNKGSASARYGNQASFDLSALLPEGARLGTPQAADEEAILEGEPALQGTILSWKLVYDAAKVGKTARVTVPVTETTNFLPYDIVITISLSDKLEQTGFGFEKENYNVVYGEDSFITTASGAAEDSKVTYTSSDTNVAVVDAATGRIQIKGAGRTVITAQAGETPDYISASASYTLTVLKKTLLWDTSGLSAVNKEGAVSSGKAALYGELKVNGVVSADLGKVTFICPADRLTGVYDDVTPGERKVTLAWADGEYPVLLQGERADNYTLPAGLPEITGTINAVSEKPVTLPGAAAGAQYKMEVETGISEVPQALKQQEKWNTPIKLLGQMKLEVKERAKSTAGIDIAEQNIIVYDVTLMVQTQEGWKAVTGSDFPKEGLTITLPYPEGTGAATHDYVVTHMFTEDTNEHGAGSVEYPAVTKTAEGIRFTVHGLSPVSVGWTQVGKLNNVDETKPDETKPDNSGSSGDSWQGEDSDRKEDAAASEPVKSPQTGEKTETTVYVLLFALLMGAGAVCSKKSRNKI